MIQKLQVGRAWDIIPSDTVNIPFPSETLSGTATSATTSKLNDSSGPFEFPNVKVGDIVENTTDGTITSVTKIDSSAQLTLATDIFPLGTESYAIYEGDRSEPCVFYVGGAGNVRVLTAGGDDVTLNGLLAGQFIPLQIIRVFSTSTTATNLIALW